MTTPRRWTIAEIKAANAAAGNFFFSPGTMRFFRSKALPYVYQGAGGVAFVTQETQEHLGTTYTARTFEPETGDIRNNTARRTRHLANARADAKAIAAGKPLSECATI